MSNLNLKKSSFRSKTDRKKNITLTETKIFKPQLRLKLTSKYYNKITDFKSTSNRKKSWFFLSGMSKHKIKIHNKSLSKNEFFFSKDNYIKSNAIKFEKELLIKDNNLWDYFLLNNKMFLGVQSVKSVEVLNVILRKESLAMLPKNLPFSDNNLRVFLSTMFLFYRKQKILLNFGIKKQFLYTLLENICAIKEDFFLLISRETLRNYFSVEGAKRESNTFSNLKNIMFFSIFGTFPVQTLKLYIGKLFIFNQNKSIWNLFFSAIYLKSISNHSNRKFDQTKNFLYCGFNSNETFIEKILLDLSKYKFKGFNATESNITYYKLLKQAKFSTIFNKGGANLSNFSKNTLLLFFIKRNFVKNNLGLLNHIWKKNFIKRNKFFFYNKKRGFGWEKKYNPFSREIPKSILFLLSKLYEKKKFISTDSIAAKSLVQLKNVLLFEIGNKIKKQKSNTLILSTRLVIKNLRRKKWALVYLKHLYNKVQNIKFDFNIIKSPINLDFKKKYTSFSTKRASLYTIRAKNAFLLKKRYSSAYKLKLSTKKQWMRRKIVRKKSLWKEKKLVQSGLNVKFNQLNNFFSFLFKNITSLYFINALSLTKFAFIYPVKKKSVYKFLNQVEREMIGRYKYVAVYIQDLVRICFLSLFLKKPTFLASFIGFQISKLPKNRKETKLIRFIMKVVKIFSSQRKEMIGLKIEFKGRVNRWRRTKIIRGIGGSKILLPLYSYNTQIEFGSSKAITRKGALGIRLWLCYKSFFGSLLSEVVLGYVEYSQRLKSKKVKKFLNKFKSRLC